jgi:hypothetical protein
MLIRNQQLLFIVFVASIDIFLMGSINSIPSWSAGFSNQKSFERLSTKKNTYYFDAKILMSQKTDDKILIKDQKILEKEIRKEEKILEKEQKNCNVAYSQKEGNKRKCESSVEDSLYPGIGNIEATDEESSRMIEELQKDIKDKSIKNVIVK